MADNSIVEAIRLKVREQIEKTEHLIQLIPPDRIEWNPQWQSGSSDIGHLLGHLLDCLAGFCAVLHAAFPDEQLEGVLELRSLPVNHFCKPDEAVDGIEAYGKFIEQGFDLCGDEDLSRMLTTVFATESVMTLLLGNLEHLINHKYQLFVYLKILGVPVGTGDIYCWRGNADSAPSQ